MGHKGELPLSDLLESSDKEDEYDDGTGAKYINCDIDGDGDGGGDKNTGAGGGYAEWLKFLSPSARTEALGAMAKSKASSSTVPRKK